MGEVENYHSVQKTFKTAGDTEGEGTAMNNGGGRDDVDNLLRAINSMFSLCLHSSQTKLYGVSHEFVITLYSLEVNECLSV